LGLPSLPWPPLARPAPLAPLPPHRPPLRRLPLRLPPPLRRRPHPPRLRSISRPCWRLRRRLMRRRPSLRSTPLRLPWLRLRRLAQPARRRNDFLPNLPPRSKGAAVFLRPQSKDKLMFKWSLILIALAVSCLFSAPASARLHPDGGFSAKASWYGGGEKLKAHTANGERFRPCGLTAAHRTLPLGTRLLVSRGSRSVVVRITDRGPAAWTGRSLDVSRGAAVKLGLIGAGVGRVHVALIK